MGFALFHRTNRVWVTYLFVWWSYQNRSETLLEQVRVCFADFKYQHWLQEITYPTFNNKLKRNVYLYDIILAVHT